MIQFSIYSIIRFTFIGDHMKKRHTSSLRLDILLPLLQLNDIVPVVPIIYLPFRLSV